MRANSIMSDPRPTLQEEEKQNNHPVAVEARRFVTKGWRIHNEATYRGIDWLLNSTIGVAFTYWSNRTEKGKKYFTEPVGNFLRKGLGYFQRNEKFLDEGTKWGTSLLGIMIGGFTIIIPMMIMENKKNKKKMVRWLDEKIYGKDVIARDPRFEESYRRIDEEPEKRFWVGMGARFIALIPIFVIAFTPKLNKYATKYLYDPIGNATKWVARTTGIKPTKGMREGFDYAHPHGDPDLPKVRQSNWDYFHQTIGFDFGLTIIYSFIHEFVYKGLASFFGIKKQEKMAKQHAHHQTVKPLEPVAEMMGDAPAESMAAKVGSKKLVPTKIESYTQAAASSRNSAAQISI